MSIENNWLEQNLKLAYPFNDYVNIAKSGEFPIKFNQMVADATVTVRCSELVDVYLTDIIYGYDVDGIFYANIHAGIVPAGSNVEFIALEQLELEQSTTCEIDGWFTVTCRFVRTDQTAYPNDFVVITLILWEESLISLLPADSELLIDPVTFSSKVLNQLPPRLDTLKIRGIDSVIFGQNLVGQDSTGMLTTGGTNVKLSLGSEITGRTDSVKLKDIRLGSVLDIEATPGEGEGRFYDCPQDDYLYSINGTGPNGAGNINLTTDNCIRVTTDTTNTVGVANDCSVCCSCEDYIAVYEAIRRLVAYGNTLQTWFTNIEQTFTELVDQWAEDYEEDTLASLKLYPRRGGVLGLQVLMYNATSDIKINPTAAFTLLPYDSSYLCRLVNGSGYINTKKLKSIQTDPVISENVVTFTGNGISLAPGEFLIYVFEVYYPFNDNRQREFPVYCTLDASVEDLDGNITTKTINGSAQMKEHLNR